MTIKEFRTVTNAKIESLSSKMSESIKPESTDINDKIYYINGLKTEENEALENAFLVQKYFNSNSVQPIFNPTKGAWKDLTKEAVFDYTWGLKFLTSGLKNTDPLTPVTYEIITILNLAKVRNLPIGIVASSQGGLMTFNAICAFLQLSPEENAKFLKRQVRFCNTGSVLPIVNIPLMKTLLNKHISCVNKKDPLASIMGRGQIVEGIWKTITAKMKFHKLYFYLPYHNHVKEYYREKTKLDENEPFVKNNFFLSPKLNENLFGLDEDWLIPVLDKWLEPFLAIMMDSSNTQPIQDSNKWLESFLNTSME